MTKERLEELLNECIGYICEVVNDDGEVTRVFDHLGFTDDEQVYFDVKEVNLPDIITINIDDIEYDPECDNIEDAISDYLSDTYGYCHGGFYFETDTTTGDITVFDIEWDTSGN